MSNGQDPTKPKVGPDTNKAGRPIYRTARGAAHLTDVPSGRKPGETWEQYEDRVLKTTKFPKDSLSSNDIKALEPDVRVRVVMLLDSAATAGHRITIRETRRSQSKQERTFQIGRTEASRRKGETPKTWTLTSEHTPGRALDIFVDGDKTGGGPGYTWLQRVAPKLGFQVGDPKDDPGHLALPKQPKQPMVARAIRATPPAGQQPTAQVVQQPTATAKPVPPGGVLPLSAVADITRTFQAPGGGVAPVTQQIPSTQTAVQAAAGAGNPFIVAAQEAPVQAPVDTAQTPDTTQTAPNPFEEVFQQEIDNPFVAAMAPRQLTMGEAGATAANVARSGLTFQQQHPLLDAIFAAPFRDGANFLVTAFMPQEQLDLIAQEEPLETIEFIKSSQRGMAFLASLPVGAAFTKIPAFLYAARGAGGLRAGLAVAGGRAALTRPAELAAHHLIGKTGAFLSGEFLAGNIYGASRPLGEGEGVFATEDETRLQAILGEGALFGATAGAGAAIFKGLAATPKVVANAIRRRLVVLPRAQRIAALRKLREQLSAMESDLNMHGSSINTLPPDERANLLANAYRNVWNDLRGPVELDLDQIAADEAKRLATAGEAAIEPHPRFEEPGRPELQVGPAPHEVAFPDPLGDIELSKEFLVPPRVEPAVKPKGFVEGAGAPERQVGGTAARGRTLQETVEKDRTLHHTLDDIRKIASGQGTVLVYHGTISEFAEKLIRQGARLQPFEQTIRDFAELYGIPYTELRKYVDPSLYDEAKVMRLSTATAPIASRWGTHFRAGEVNDLINSTVRMLKAAKRLGITFEEALARSEQVAQRAGKRSTITNAPDFLDEPDLFVSGKEGALVAFEVDVRALPEHIRQEAAATLKEFEAEGPRALDFWNNQYKDIKVDPRHLKRGHIVRRGLLAPEAVQQTVERVPVNPNTIRMLPDGSVEVVGYRGTHPGRAATEPGLGGAAFLADNPVVASHYRSTAGSLTSATPQPSGRVTKVRTVFKKPYIVDSFLELEMGPADAARYRELSDKSVKGTITAAERAESDEILKRGLETGEAVSKLRDEGYDGIIIMEGLEGPEIVALHPGMMKVEAELLGDEFIKAGLNQNRIFAAFDKWVLPLVRQGSDLFTAIKKGAQSAALFVDYGGGGEGVISRIAQAFAKIATFMGDDLGKVTATKESIQALREGAAKLNMQRTTEEVGRTLEAALEPRAVTPGMAPPKGFQPTRVGDTAEGVSTQLEQLALTDAAVRDATARLDPLSVATPELNAERVLIEDAVGDINVPRLDVPHARMANVLDKALLRENSAAAEGILLELTAPSPTQLESATRLKGAAKVEAKRASEALAKSLERESENLVEISPSELVRAQWAYGPTKSAVPALDVIETAARMTEEQLNLLSNRLGKLATGEAGFVTGRALALILGVGAEIASLNDSLPKGPANTLRAIGGLLLAGALHPQIAKFLANSKTTRNFILNMNPTYLLKDAGAKEGLRKLQETLTWSRELGHNQRLMIETIFKPKDYRNAIIAIEESDFARGIFPVEYYQLSPNQQKAVEALNAYNLALGQMLHGEGILQAYRRNYVSHKLPPDALQRWQTHGFKTLQTGGGFTKQRIFTFRELEIWAKQNGVAAPITDLAQLQSKHITEAYRALGNVRMLKTFEGLGLIQDMTKQPLTNPPAGMRQLRIAGMGTKMAPEDLATAIENLASNPQSNYEILNIADTLKSYWMRSIMFWFWEHGINVMRVSVLASLNPARYADAWGAISRMDPGVIEAAKYGLSLRQRTDYGELAKSVERLIQKTQNIPGLNQVVKLGGGLMKWNETALWEKLVPTAQYMVYSTQMHKWAERTAGKFVQGTPQYIAAARQAADIANTMVGRLPTDLANPRLMQWMRLLFFSPQWTGTRLAMTAHAAGELSEVLAGRLNPTHAVYLPMKMRQLAYAAIVTWLGSKALSGKEPEFNPNTNKFYMRTGMKGPTGREVGIDVTGFWQDDLKLFNRPWDFVAGRLNPMLRTGIETVTGRDYLGRPMTGMQKIENITRSFGVPVESLEFGIRAIDAATGGPKMSAGEILQRTSGSLATFNVSTLPRPVDVVLAKMAERLLRAQHLPTDDASIFELTRLLRGNLLAGHRMVDGRVITYLSYRRRTHRIASPIFGPIDHLWQHGRKVLADF